MSFLLIIISQPALSANETATVTDLFENGMDHFHLRKAQISKAEFRKFLSAIPQKFHKKIVLHSHHSLVNEFELKGIHLTEKARKRKLPSSFDPKKHSLSASFHSISHINNSKRKYNYLFLSPVFDSISKKEYKNKFEVKELAVLNKRKKNIVALGGIEPKTIKQVKAMGFSGAASLGYIWESKDPVKAFKALLSKIK